MYTPNLVQVLTQEEDSRYVDGQLPFRYIRVRFKVGTFGPFTKEFAKDTYSAAVRDAELQKFGREIWVDPPPPPIS